ncbi:XrtA system polysaccharide chain length determinant [Rubrivivax gelatinosus]|uniref:XrtA system polysaccharide chain length determinant n=1 Tax=Rubrivivax gelatinosus TaxID=28068 RepID=UPI000315335D|nr:XrtA system polysaccharide chain length determinant [Rubrivivax gelatinosus]MBG6080372.1 polysaccharide chain length determinant protein (PEP-CTERM system associated) [Rubrivivax gelatinosus]
MQDLVRQALAVLRGMWNYRWQGLVVAWVIGIVAAVVALRVPDEYEASARIYVDTQSILKPLMSGLTVQPNVEQQISMLSRTLISRPNIEKLIRMADLDLSEGSAVEQEDLIQRLTKDIQIRNTGRDNLYSLVYRDRESEKAKRVIQSLVSIFVESSLGASRKDTDSAKTFLNEQIKQYEQKLEEAEARLKEFRLRNIDRTSPDGKDAASNVATIAAQVQQAQLELREAESARAAAKAQLDAERGRGSDIATQSLLQESSLSVSTPEIDARLDAQRRNLDNLLQRYTDQHPDVVTTRKLIKDLEAQKAKEVAELRKAQLASPSGAVGPHASLAMQELGRALASAEVQVASLQARVAEYSARLAAARASLKTAPQIEAEAAQLNRDYDVYKKNYQDLVARRQSAIMSGELEVASGVADFRLIDPPRVAPEPVAPNRLLLLLAALGAAVAAGLAVAFAGSQLRPVYNDAIELRSKTGLPLLGVVSLVLSEDERRRERAMTLRFVGASGGLVGLYAIGIVAMALLAQRAASV